MPEMVCDAPSEPRADPPGFRVRLAQSPADVLGYAAVAGRGVRAPRDAGRDDADDAVATTEPLLADEVAIASPRIAHGRDRRRQAAVDGRRRRSERVRQLGLVRRRRARGHGLGDAVTRLVTNEGFARGARLLTLEASPYGRNTYDRMGYQTLYDYRLLIKV